MRPVIVLALGLSLGACKVREAPPIVDKYGDLFERSSIGPDYNQTGSGFRIVDGALNAKGAHNRPLWLAKKLPAGDLQIDFDAWSKSPDGDIKIEVFGDGRSYDADGNRYMATSYVLVFGAWKNTKSVIVRLDEHGKDVVQRTEPRVEAGRRYHWRIVRRGRVLDWFIDDLATPFLHYDDPTPLIGPGHEFFGFGNWETDTYFDNLVIRRL
jgi:hypothetical protein